MRTLRSIAGGYEACEYAKMNDKDIAEHVREIGINEKGYFMYPSQLFVNVALIMLYQR